MLPTITRRAAPAVLTLALLSSALPASGGSLGDPAAALSRARATAARLGASADAIRADLTSASFTRVVGRLVALAGLPEPSHASPTADALPALPPAIAPHVADLLAAATFAADAVRDAIALDGGRSLALAARADRLGHRIALALATGHRWPVEAARALKAEVTAGAVLRASATGGLAIAAALDRSLTPLRAGAATLPRRSGTAPACDMLDQRPTLCVSGTADNANDAEAVLMVDLGGDDTYTSSAGGANSARCVDDPDDTSCNASVLVDVTGKDSYLVGAATSHDHLVAGGSAMSGVGVLVDAAGADEYLATIAPRATPLDISYVFGSAGTGLGLLADLRGADRYEVTARPELFNPYTHGAALDGMGALIDGGGANTYRMIEEGVQVPDPDPELSIRGNRSASSMGVGIFGVGALVDRTGDATFEARIDTTAGAQPPSNYVNPIAQGVGLIGAGVLVTGTGSTTYKAIARRVASASIPGQSAEPEPDEFGEVPPTGSVPGGAAATAHSVAVLGVGILDDAGGDDTYRAFARSEHHLLVTAEDGCGCDRAIARLEVAGWDEFFGGAVDAASAGVSTQGVGSALFVPDAGAMLRDGGGNDVYSGRAEMEITARAENRLDDPSAGARAEVIYSRPTVSAFGQGLGSDFAPTVLLDSGGDDTYELVADQRIDASADAGDGPATGSAMGGEVSTFGQGSSYFDPAEGILLDLGGSDSYETHAISHATTAPNPGGARNVPKLIAAQGAVGGILADLDEGIADSFTATPERGPGVGVRGEGPGWVDISNTFPGYGIAPAQPAKRDVTLAMDPANAARGNEGIVPFRARLTDAGAPVAGREVIFDIEWESPSTTGTQWIRHYYQWWGITDDTGWVTGLVDVGEFAGFHTDAADMTVRIAARFHGDADRRPALATQPFDVEA